MSAVADIQAQATLWNSDLQLYLPLVINVDLTMCSAAFEVLLLWPVNFSSIDQVLPSF
jgi:hypothetical protein